MKSKPTEVIFQVGSGNGDEFAEGISGDISSKIQLARITENSMLVASQRMRDIVEKAKVIAPLDLPVLITGETGVGKEMLAQLIHGLSGRKGAFKALNSAGLPETLVDSELFGHTKGAFTGAIAEHTGVFEQANRGTLFLDEISDMSQVVQAKILRATDRDGIFSPVGSKREIRTDCRLISATNRPMQELIHERRFREDLFYRLSGFCIDIPPLRERHEDIVVLAQGFLSLANSVFGKNLVYSESALTALCQYAWPGNVRELRNVVERAAATRRGQILEKGDLQFNGYSKTVEVREAIEIDLSLNGQIKKILIEALERNRWHHKRTAKELGVSRRILELRMFKLGIENPPGEGFSWKLKKRHASCIKHAKKEPSEPIKKRRKRTSVLANPSPPIVQEEKAKPPAPAEAEVIPLPVLPSVKKPGTRRPKGFFGRDFLMRTFAANGWNQTKTAEALDTMQSFLSQRAKKYKIVPPSGSWRSKSKDKEKKPSPHDIIMAPGWPDKQ